MNFNKTCRICGEIIKDKHSETVDDNKSQIYKYLPIKDSDEGFPKNLCVDCLNMIDSWDVFYKRCEKSQKKFTALLKNKKTKKPIATNKEKISPLKHNNDKEKTIILLDHDGTDKEPNNILEELAKF